MTACKNCEYLLKVSHYTPPIWYHLRCKAVRTPAEYDPYSGELKEGDYAYCRDVDNGNCEHFKEKRRP